MKKSFCVLLALAALAVFCGSVYALDPVNPSDPQQVAALKKDADSGDRGAQYDLSMVYEFQQKPAASLKYLRMSAEAGYGRAQYTLGNVYYSGAGVKKNYAEASKWFKVSKESGYNGDNVDAYIADSDKKVAAEEAKKAAAAKKQKPAAKTKTPASKKK